MSNSLQEIFINQMISDFIEDEDRKAMSMLGLVNLDVRNRIGVIRLHNGRSISVYRDGGGYIFQYFNHKKNMLLDAHEANDVLSGVEYFVAFLEQSDAEILWNWFLDYGK